MSIQALIKKKQNRLLSKTWRTTLIAREIEKNNFYATGDVKKAREFAYTAANYQPGPDVNTTNEPITVYSAV